MTDSYQTIKSRSEGTYTELRSKFLAFAIPVKTAEEAMAIVSEYQKKYYDARHVCFAYMLGAERDIYRANDNGEPSGTAGKPILGQINSRNLTDILIIVVRYFGGIKLGTSGLIVAYRMAAQAALDAAEVVERVVSENLTVSFDYSVMNSVMRMAKDAMATLVDQQCDDLYHVTFSVRRSSKPVLKENLSKIHGVLKID